MNGRYDGDIDTFWFIKPGTNNIGEPVSKKLTLFLLAEDEESLVGFELTSASKSMHELCRLPLKWRLAGLLVLIRKLERITQAEFAEKTGISLSMIKKAESMTDSNLSLNTIHQIISAFPKYDFTSLMKADFKYKETA